jgi:16S rRNA (guanine527-N7)-methyltransferase
MGQIPAPARRAVEWSGWSLDVEQVGQLGRYASWLTEEAIPAGGLGPNEGERVWDRHVADSLLFAGAWPPPDPPSAVIDLGSGVGLPGIPLAILWPVSQVSLVDRSGRRVDLLRRAGRVVGLDNVDVIQADAGTLVAEADLVVGRAVADPETVEEWGRRVVRPGGAIVIGGSHTSPPPEVEGTAILTVPGEILDRGVWLRMISPS